jgi:hypothetical protein
MQLPSKQGGRSHAEVSVALQIHPRGEERLREGKSSSTRSCSEITIESAGGKLELFNWTVPGSDYSGITIAEFPDASTYTAVFALVKATGAFSEIKAVELLTASEIDRGLGTWGLVAQADKIMS